MTSDILKKLYYRSWHRGTKEMDLILGQFADKHLANFTADDIVQYEAILAEDDQDLYQWITGDKPVPEEKRSNMLMRLIVCVLLP